MSAANPPRQRVAVIGAGPGGYTAAFLAADLGMSVDLIDPSPTPGGVCLHRGCIPSKALLHATHVMAEARAADRWGIHFEAPQIDLAQLRQWKDGVVRQLTDGLAQLSQKRKVRYHQGLAHFRDAHQLEVQLASGENEAISFDHAILATGSTPASVPGLAFSSPKIVDSAGALELADIPPRLLVVGGGYIGLELGSVYAGLGSAVTVVEMTPHLLPGVDADLVRPLQKRLQKTLAEVRVNTRVERVTEEADGLHAVLTGPATTTAVFDKVLVAVGRTPNTRDLGLENTRVKIDEKGFVGVDQQRRTAEPSVFAIGDITGQPMLAHKAAHEGRVAVEVIAGMNATFEPQAIPAVVFTDPEIAWAGLSGTASPSADPKPIAARFPWAASGRALTTDRTDGLTKLLVDPDTERILGVGVVGTNAGELIGEGILALEMDADVTDLRLSIHPHPTLSETLMEAAEVFRGESTHVFRPRRKRPA